MLTAEQIAASARAVTDDGYALWLASNAEVLSALELAPAGVAITPLDFLAAQPEDRAWSTADLMRTYNVLNATSFGEKGIPLQNWVMIDLGLLPSAFLLVTLPLERATALATDPGSDARTRTILPAVIAEAQRLGYAGPIPVAGYCAAPTPEAGAWVGWSLCSAVPGLGTTAKGLALIAYRARRLTGVAQFYDPALRVHRKFGPMRLLAAVLDLHPVHHTMAYRTDVFGPEQSEAEPTLLLDPRDLDAQWGLQQRLDAGTHEYFILSPGLVQDRVPILERTI
jgi:hypothetical protein